MFNLVYQSTATPAFGQSQILNFLENAREFNNLNGITGCLLFYEGTFVQYLEGNRNRVLALFDKIKHDHRHSQVSLLSQGDINTRAFPHYDMAYENFQGSNYQLEYLKILVSSYVGNPDMAISPNPTSTSFWTATEKLLSCSKNKELK